MEKETESESKDFFDTVYEAVKGKWAVCTCCLDKGFVVKMREIDTECREVGYSNHWDTPPEYEVISRLYECPECFYSEWIDEPK